MNRRNFIATSLAAGAFPMIFGGCRSFGANEKVRVGIIGYGRIASTFEVPCVLERKDIARIVAVCDLDSKRANFGAETIEKAYNDGTKIDVYHDYKELLAREDIDAVMICLPDFWHAIVSAAAIKAGKAVWLQKPFTQTIGEGRIIADLAKKHHTVFQVGSQQRSWTPFKRACQACLDGKIGKIKRIEVGIGLDKAGGSSKPEKVPANFDYDTWLGPTDHNVPYNHTRCHNDDLNHLTDRPGWIQLAPYGWGMITNWGAHHLDVVRWGLNALAPEKVEGTCKWMDLSGDKLWNVHTNYDLHYTFNNGFTDVHVWDGYQMGVKFIGENGDWVFCSRSHERVTPSDPLPPPLAAGQLPPLAASKEGIVEPLGMEKVRSTQAHVSNWLEAVQASDPKMTVTNAEGGHRSTSLCSLGQMCMELGRGKKDGFSLNWDGLKETTGVAEFDKLMKPFENGNFKLEA